MATYHNVHQYTKLDPAHKALWVSALRSGEYTQAYGWLWNRTREHALAHCCIGVGYCAIMGRPVHEDVVVPRGPLTDLTPMAACSIGLNDDTQLALVGLNDTQRASFAKIADWIEENL
jgi:hypothetical protein